MEQDERRQGGSGETSRSFQQHRGLHRLRLRGRDGPAAGPVVRGRGTRRVEMGPQAVFVDRAARHRAERLSPEDLVSHPRQVRHPQGAVRCGAVCFREGVHVLVRVRVRVR